MYLRLSKGDGDVDGIGKEESNSITNQRMIILSFLEKHKDLKLVDTYIDDGYTGLKSVYIVNNNKLYGLYDDKHQIVPCICKSIECISDRIGYWVLNYEDEKILFYNLEEIESFFHELNNRNDYNLIM